MQVKLIILRVGLLINKSGQQGGGYQGINRQLWECKGCDWLVSLIQHQRWFIVGLDPLKINGQQRKNSGVIRIRRQLQQAQINNQVIRRRH